MEVHSWSWEQRMWLNDLRSTLNLRARCVKWSWVSRHHVTVVPHIDIWSGSICRLWNADDCSGKASKWTFEMRLFYYKNSCCAVCCSAVALTWSHRAICRSFQREVPVVRSIFMLPRISTLLALCVLQFASYKHTAEHIKKKHQAHLTFGIYRIKLHKKGVD